MVLVSGAGSRAGGQRGLRGRARQEFLPIPAEPCKDVGSPIHPCDFTMGADLARWVLELKDKYSLGGFLQTLVLWPQRVFPCLSSVV